MMNNALLKAILLSFCFWFGFSTNLIAQADTTVIKSHFQNILQTENFRNYRNPEALNQTARYIFNQFQKFADTVYYQTYRINGTEYKNVVCSFGTGNVEHIVVGAHYDVCGMQDGADDNASGVVGILELARLLKGKSLHYQIDLVAYTLEEPPYFSSKNMGSYIHAKSLHDAQTAVKGMIALEMIGYFKDAKNTQSYPLDLLKLFYGSRGDYITLVKKFGAGKFVRRFSKRFKKAKTIKTKKFTGPPALPGIDFSDHRNYWEFGWPALMITDTAFYRNQNYHQSTDTLKTLDLYRMAKVIDSMLEALLNFK